ncbi:MAG: winged helix-turn-helix transcriptional regulator [Clostridia bacterium]|nr:winged helix-turn-helix transcriptional regulator [Clostridia bacterium]
MEFDNQTLEVANKLKECRPLEFFKNIDEINSGMGFIVMHLYETQCEVFAIELSKMMDISRARVAMLVKKLIAKGLVEKEISCADARKEIIKITDKGRLEVERVRQKIFNNITKVIHELGIDKVNEFVEISQQIKNIIKN